ncbi:hypothetical protein JCM21900_000573 [Sporobolomyces salmonicolor]
MARGNQRENVSTPSSACLRTSLAYPVLRLDPQDRAKAQKKAEQLAKGQRKESGASLKARQESDADIMRKKQEAAAAKKAAGAGAKA